jgi:hypothetical protein
VLQGCLPQPHTPRRRGCGKDAPATAGPLYRALLAQQVQDAVARGAHNWLFLHLQGVLRWLLPHDLWTARFIALVTMAWSQLLANVSRL